MTPSADSTRDLLAAVDSDWTASPPVVAPVSAPDVAELDAGWSEEEEALFDEPLPDERLDPVAYAEAQKAREERLLARREKRRAKTSAKRDKQKAREASAQSKQKAKSKRPLRARDESPTDDVEAAALPAVVAETPAPAKSKPKVAAPSKLPANTTLLALAVMLFLAGAAVVAAIANR